MVNPLIDPQAVFEDNPLFAVHSYSHSSDCGSTPSLLTTSASNKICLTVASSLPDGMIAVPF